MNLDTGCQTLACTPFPFWVMCKLAKWLYLIHWNVNPLLLCTVLFVSLSLSIVFAKTRSFIHFKISSWLLRKNAKVLSLRVWRHYNDAWGHVRINPTIVNFGLIGLIWRSLAGIRRERSPVCVASPSSASIRRPNVSSVIPDEMDIKF